jgi:sugar/nucleoside kinase (ribokinase family)
VPRYDYVSMGFYTYDCLGWPYTEVPPGGGTVFIDELTLAVSGAGGTAAIAAAKMGMKTLAVAGVGDDLMGDWVLQRLQHFGVDTSCVQHKPGWKTSSSIVLTRADGSRPALHRKGATSDFFVTDGMIPQVTDTKVFHAGGVGLMDAMDKGQSAVVMKAAKAAGAITTVDVFAGSPSDLPAVAHVLPYTDYFMPSIEEAQALCGLSDHADTAKFFLDLGVKACVLTLGGDGAYYHDSARHEVPRARLRHSGEVHLRLRRCLRCRLRGGARQGLRSGDDGALRAGDLGAQRHGPGLAGRRQGLRAHAPLHEHDEDQGLIQGPLRGKHPDLFLSPTNVGERVGEGVAAASDAI